MPRQIVLAALPAAGLALLPVLYLHFIWPTVLAFVPIHYGSGGPNHFVGREWLRNIGWLPTLAFMLLTFLPQVHDGQRLFWSSYHQRRTRLVVVGSLALVIMALVYRGAHHSRASLLPSPATRAR